MNTRQDVRTRNGKKIQNAAEINLRPPGLPVLCAGSANTPGALLVSFHRSKTRFAVKAALAHIAPVEEAASVVTPPEFASRRCTPSHPARYLRGPGRETGSRSGLCTCPRNYLVDRRLVP